LEQGRQSGCTGIEVNAILGVNAVYVPTDNKLNTFKLALKAASIFVLVDTSANLAFELSKGL
jgi:hypothetical protein